MEVEESMTMEELLETIDAEDDMDEQELHDAFLLVYERAPDEEDETVGLYSLIIAGLLHKTIFAGYD